ncbi:MAG: CDP-alcohol phosphatidyltransferase family protein [Candidatus Portnoybacteria bacterium]|nr:CDP-alcohol phosphatidyltransferase family protein [Candidatus Portnoybacteria bacterium]
MEEELSLWRWYGSLIRENAANFLTAVRILIVVGYLLPCFFFLGLDPWTDHRFFWLMIAAALTDLFDGIVARRTRKTPSEFGKNFDKVADKICEVFIFSAMIATIFYSGQCWLLVFFIPNIRSELELVGIWLYGYRNGKDSGAGWWGKRKMATYFATAIVWFAPNEYWNFLKGLISFDFTGYFFLFVAFLLVVASILGLMSFLGYLRRYGAL